MTIPKFIVYDLVNHSHNRVETEDDGRFLKSWINVMDLGRGLFKAGFTSEPTSSQQRLDWREKVAYELGKLLNLPMAKTELASLRILEKQGAIPGTISLDYTPDNASVISLREFLVQADPNYDNSYSDNFEDGYNVANVITQLEGRAVGLPQDWQAIEGIIDGADLLVGYLTLDTWLGATDRHDENIEIAVSSTGYSLCPSFDHGDCLGSKLSDPQQELGDWNDPLLSESCWWEIEAEISTIRALEIAAKIRPNAARVWQQSLNRITSAQINKIFECIPDDRITLTSARFAQDLLAYNKEIILNLNFASSAIKTSEAAFTGESTQSQISPKTDRHERKNQAKPKRSPGLSL